MIYIDSDGVLSDFDQWLLDMKCENHNNSTEVYKTTIKYYKNAFLDSKPIKRNNWLRKIMIREDFRILSSLPNKADFKKLFDDDASFKEVYETLRENKYKWFENIGVPRNKVIIVDTRKDKFKYCKIGDILYDDFPDTVKEWTRLGGHGILVKNLKCRAQKERYQKYAHKNFEQVITTIQQGLYRFNLYHTFTGKNYYPEFTYEQCVRLARLDTEDQINSLIKNHLIYNPYSGKMYLTRAFARILKVRTGSNNIISLAEYLYNCYPILFPKSYKDIKCELDEDRLDISDILAEFIPKDEVSHGMSIEQVY